jgi:outer membrane lipoprotein SlyB
VQSIAKPTVITRDKKMKKLTCIALALSLTACATYRPIVDLKGVDQNAYENDLKECQALAQQVEPGKEMAGGAAIGAVFGALLGAAVGGRGMAGYGAKIGAVNGLGAGAASGTGGQLQTIRYCLVGRGYKVLR